LPPLSLQALPAPPPGGDARPMIRSMTGFGQATAELPGVRVTVELRSVNHRFADLRLRLPSELAGREVDVRKKILTRVSRGRVEVSVSIAAIEGGEPRPQLDRALLEEVLAASKVMNEEFGLKGRPEIHSLLAIPGMFKVSAPEVRNDDERRAAVEKAFDEALAGLDRERCREGWHLRDELLSRQEKIASLTAEIRERAAGMPDSLRDRLLERLQALGGGVELDPGRVAQEAAILADRCDVTEELVRLDGHRSQVEALLRKPDGEPVGKRLEFLAQEMNRETNTINSKSSDLEISRCALALKAELEKVREQIQNLE
jgi:uncharacterized protein (TIGR00255 family)